MKDRLGKLLAAREARKAELVRLAESCQDVEELRRMNAEIRSFEILLGWMRCRWMLIR